MPQASDLALTAHGADAWDAAIDMPVAQSRQSLRFLFKKWGMLAISRAIHLFIRYFRRYIKRQMARRMFGGHRT